MNVEPSQEPVDLLIAIEEASETPIRPEYVEGMVVVPPRPDDSHNSSATELSFQLHAAGIRSTGLGNGFRSWLGDNHSHALVIPDFYVMHRRPTDRDEAYRTTHKGWYPIDLLALTGEVTFSNHDIDSGPKYRSYAAAGVPVYVLIHRQEAKAYAFSDPVPGDDPATAHYATKVEVELGRPLPLPAPYPALDTAVLLKG
ncbi:Uma2 family endonuclease [Streptomyces sp. NPDC093109]|uniref:Uma2 family endonuclease n=1 Tax=Streptomyces sp. NPDC093109 TaxID=3154977 RepID=UPI00344BB6E6